MKRIVIISLLALAAGCSNWPEKLERVSQGIDSLSPPLQAHTLDLNVEPDGLAVAGQVASESDKARVLEIARNSVDGENVIDKLQVVPPAEPKVYKREMTQQEQAILKKIASTIPMGGYNLMLVTKDDALHIEGSVANQVTKNQITKLAKDAAPGIVIKNDLKEFTPLPDTMVLAKVKETLKNQMPEIFSKLDITCDRGVVTFTGNVAEHQEIDRALATTIMIDGVKDVRSKVVING